MSADALTRLGALLRHERALILTGHIDQLGDLAQAKISLLDHIARARVDAPALARMRAEAARNATLIAAVLSGLRRTYGRLTNSTAESSVYSANGSRNVLSTASGSERPITRR